MSRSKHEPISWSQHGLLDVARVKANSKTKEGATEELLLGLLVLKCILPEEKGGGQRDVDVVEVDLLLIGEVPDEHRTMF